jgi:hypothetical protein
MTLKEIAQHVCDVTGLTDNLSVDQAKAFVRRRWQMLWDFHLWRQSLIVAQMQVMAGSDTYAAHHETDQITGAKLRDRNGNDILLLPVGDDFGEELFPEHGTPKYFQQMPKNMGVLSFKLMPCPVDDYVMSLKGKRKCPPLTNDEDEPSISGSSNALIAYSMGDMFEYMRQFTKAQAKFTEAVAHQEKMIEIERAQSANIPVLRPLATYTGHDFNCEMYWEAGL